MVKLSHCFITAGKNKGKIKYHRKGKAYYVGTVAQVPEKSKRRGRNKVVPAQRKKKLTGKKRKLKRKSKSVWL